MNSTYPQLAQAEEFVRDAQRILVLSGAGLSKASGIPTYRDADGLWETGDNINYSHEAALRENPKGFQRFWKERIHLLKAARPNTGHQALFALQAAKPETLMVTQNVDGLLSQAGCQDVIELHGNILRMRCSNCARTRGLVFNRCLACRGYARPNVVLFGETLPEDKVQRAMLAATKADVVLVVGTSAVVYPAAQIPAVALNFGAKLIVIDTYPPLLAHAAHVVLKGPAEEMLPQLVAAL